LPKTPLFHAALALIVERTGKEPKRHASVQRQFHQLTRHDPAIPQSMRDFILRAYDDAVAPPAAIRGTVGKDVPEMAVAVSEPKLAAFVMLKPFESIWNQHRSQTRRWGKIKMLNDFIGSCFCRSDFAVQDKAVGPRHTWRGNREHPGPRSSFRDPLGPRCRCVG
jgi:hypothetical protein